MTKEDLILKAKRVINNSNTLEQLNNAFNYLYQLDKVLKDDDVYSELFFNLLDKQESLCQL